MVRVAGGLETFSLAPQPRASFATSKSAVTPPRSDGSARLAVEKVRVSLIGLGAGRVCQLTWSSVSIVQCAVGSHGSLWFRCKVM